MANPASTRFLDQVFGAYRIDSILASLLLAAFYLSVQLSPEFQKIVLDFFSQHIDRLKFIFVILITMLRSIGLIGALLFVFSGLCEIISNLSNKLYWLNRVTWVKHSFEIYLAGFFWAWYLVGVTYVLDPTGTYVEAKMMLYDGSAISLASLAALIFLAPTIIYNLLETGIYNKSKINIKN